MRFRALKIYFFGIAVHAGMLACMLLLPWDNAVHTLSNISLPVMLIYPAGVVALTLLLLSQGEYKEAITHAAEADSRYKSLFHNNSR